MPIFRRPNRLGGFSLIDALVGVLLLATTAGLFVQVVPVFVKLFENQAAKARVLWEVSDEKDLDSHL